MRSCTRGGSLTDRPHAVRAGAILRIVRRTLLLAAGVAAVAVAGCGSSDLREIAAWRVQAPYIPPPEPAARTVRAPAATTPKAPPAGERAPTDAEVARELERAYGTKAGRIVNAATVTAGGMATVPASAPSRVAAIIAAANQVARKPYVYGGGHGRLAGETFVDTAYDCSGSVSFALAAAGFIDSPMDSTALARFGKPGPGRWVTIYANAGHAFMTVAGLRFDTSGRDVDGSRWQARTRPVAGFTIRHPPGL
jgi:cell wall-associated NlpC family hydrolase